MKSIFVLSFVIFTVNCGLLDNVLEKKEESKKPDLLKKVVTDLKDDGQIIVDTLTAPFKKNADDKKDSTDKKEPEKPKPTATEVTDTTPKTTEDAKSKQDTSEVKETTPKDPEASPNKTEESTTKTELPTTKAENESITPKTKANETSTPKAK